jgi:hypothetical protein
MMTAALVITCTLFRPWPQNTLRCFASLRLADIDLIIHDIAVHQKGGARWAQVPAKPQVRDGELIKDADGRIQYIRMLDFGSRAARVTFSAAVVAAALEHAPDSFDDGHQRPQAREE